MKHGYLIDMDGVIYRGSEVIPGAAEFIRHLQEERIPYLFLTNNSAYTPLDVVVKLRKFDIETTADHVYTAALATAEFVHRQKPNGTAFVSERRHPQRAQRCTLRHQSRHRTSSS
jgi:NagD protein